MFQVNQEQKKSVIDQTPPVKQQPTRKKEKIYETKPNQDKTDSPKNTQPKISPDLPIQNAPAISQPEPPRPAEHFNWLHALKNFALGIISPVTSLFSSPKNFLIGVACIAIGAGLIIATGGAITPFFIAAGVCFGAYKIGSGIYKIATAKSEVAKEDAFFDIGAGTSSIAISLVGANRSLQAGGFATENLPPVAAVAKNFSVLPQSAARSAQLFQSGQALENISCYIGGLTGAAPLEAEATAENPMAIKKVATPADVKEFVVPRSSRVAVTGYSASPEGYEATATKFTTDLVTSLGQKSSSLVTSPTASAGSIDAIATATAHSQNIPIRYVTADEFLEYIKPEELPAGVNQGSFMSATKLSLPTTTSYSEAATELSNSLVVEGGRNQAVLDYANAISHGNKTVILEMDDVATPAWDASKLRVGNASLYIADQVNGFAKTGTLPHPEVSGFSLDFIRSHQNEIQGLTDIVHSSDPNAASNAANF